jgi:hypothetical protein
MLLSLSIIESLCVPNAGICNGGSNRRNRPYDISSSGKGSRDLGLGAVRGLPSANVTIITA